MWVFDVSVLFVVRLSINTLMTAMCSCFTCGKCVIYWQVAWKNSLLTGKRGTQASFTLLRLHGLYRVWPLGFPTMLLATGRRPPSMSKGGMWPECGSDCRDGGRESRTREHGQGKGGNKGSAQRAADSLLSKWSFCLAFYLSCKWEKPTVEKNMEFLISRFALCVCICTASVSYFTILLMSVFLPLILVAL